MIHYSKLHYKTKIEGSLGKPLGEIITIKAGLLPEEEKRSRSDEDVALLKVTEVNGSRLDKPVKIRFERFAFDSSAEIKPGKSYRIIGYETGGMTGIPEEAFDHMLPVSTGGYFFEVYFQVVKVE